jgi:predicted GNAT superfamily acetyltransferase
LKNEICIKNLQTVEELEKVRKLEALIWGFGDSIPINQTVAAVKNGGFVLGALLNEKLIGFQYSFPGFDGKKSYLCSHSLGIHPDYRKLGIGERLKVAQKETAIFKGYDLITWTYDPLETVNGNLNLHKLGGVCTTYIENAYGEMADDLNAGIPSDRFLVEWWITNPTENIELVEEVPLSIHTSLKNGFLVPEKVNLNQFTNIVFVPVPGNFQDMKREDFSLALKWREITRQVFRYYFNRDWMVTDLVKDREKQGQYLYLLKKK